MGFQFSALVLLLALHLVFAGQQSHAHDSLSSDHHSSYTSHSTHFSQTDGQQQAEQIVVVPANEPTYQSSDHKSLHVQVTNQQQPEPVPTRWRTIRDSQLDIRNEQTTNLDGNYLERKHEESRRRAVRMRSLQTLQNEIRKELESNETTLSEQLRANKEHLDSRSVQMLVNAIQDCVQRYERIQVELQKLYRDQIFEEKELLDHYRKLRPNELDLHNQIKLAIDRWQLIYNQLLDMQLQEKERNAERKAEYGRLLDDLELKNQRKSTQHLSASSSGSSSASSSSSRASSGSSSSIHHLADLNYPYSNQPQHQQHTIHSSHSPHLDSKTSSSEFVSSSSYHSSSSSSSGYGEPDKSSYSSYSSMKTSGSHQPTTYYSSSSSSTGKVGGVPMSAGKTQLPIQLEENSLIFRRPESLKNVTCLHKWFEDLGREDADWMKRQQIKNENWFEELVRLQKAQWDKLHEEHNQRKEQHLPKTFKCELESKTLCDQEEENFKKMWSQYRVEQYPPTKGNQQSLNQKNLNQQNQQSYNQHQNYYQPTYGQQQQQRQQPIIYSSSSSQKSQQTSFSN